MKKSVWHTKSNLPRFEKLRGDKKTHILIVGGGIAGILCAHFLHKAGADYILAEAGKVCSGVTRNTTAKLTFEHGLIYDNLIKNAGHEKAKMYLEANHDAFNEYVNLCKSICCDFEKRDAYTYTTKNIQKIENEIKALSSLGYDTEFESKVPLPIDIKGAIVYRNQAQFNPLMFLSHIAKDLNIYEDTKIREISKNTAVADDARIFFDKIIVCTHFPFVNKHGSYFLKLYQHRSYVSAYENAPAIDGMYVDEDCRGMSFRTYDNMLLVGGGSHRTGKAGGAWKEIDNFAKNHYPDAVLKYQWATQDCMSLDGIPYAGAYSKSTPNMYVVSGFNKWGMTNSMACAKIICDLAMDRKNDFAPVFSPQRSMLKPQLFINSLEASINLITPTIRRCPHLGCALKWNKHEHTWDCPCHGSRFEKDGKLIDNPATGNAKVK